MSSQRNLQVFVGSWGSQALCLSSRCCRKRPLLWEMCEGPPLPDILSLQFVLDL